jgi:FxsC-like protein
MPRFFMSHAREDDGLQGDDLVSAFFTDLCGQIAQGVEDPPESVGYLDTANLDVGDNWSEVLAEAVCTSAVFVPILTARYFTRPYCGREWQLFETRCAEVAVGGQAPPLIVPILWKPPLEGSLPTFATDLQFRPSARDFLDDDRRLLPELLKRGLVQIIKGRNARYGSLYDGIVEKLAAKIVSLGNDYPLNTLAREALPALADVQPRFPSPKAATRGSPATALVGRVPVAHFAYVAADAATGGALRANGTLYYRGDNGGGWYPYAPVLNKPIALLAQRAAGDKELVAQVLEIDEQFLTKIRAAEDRREPVILLIDPWSAARVPNLTNALANFDRLQFANCAVLIAWDFFDVPLPQDRDTLQGQVKAILERRFQAGHLLREQIDAGTLMQQLGNTLADLDKLLAPLRGNRRPISNETTALPPSISPATT